jgi:hypothetical protein
MQSKSEQMKIANANRAGLSGVARDVYLRGIARLSKAQEVADKGNNGKGYVVPCLGRQ